jgi:peroxiredoxin
MSPALSAAALALSLGLLAPAFNQVQAFDDSQKFKVGDKAPDFTLKDLEGGEVRLSSFAGNKVVLLTFFALRCSTCLMEAPYLEKTHRKYKDRGVIILSVNTDGVDAATAARTMKDVGFDSTYTILLDQEFTVTDTYTNFLVPLTLVIDKDGIIRYIHTGFDPGDEKKYEKAIKKAL